MSALDSLTELLKKMPGIGIRQARRLAYFLLSADQSFIRELIQALNTLHADMAQCRSCYRFFKKQNGNELCDICANASTDSSTILVVEKDVDFENIRKQSNYLGLFFVLGGSLPILAENPTEKIRIKQLIASIEKWTHKGLKEIILACAANPEGDNTSQYIKKTLEPLAQKHGITITILGRGLSTGTELEYSDADTFAQALENRK